VGEFPEHVDNKKGSKDNRAGVFMAFDHIEEGHGSDSDENHQAFIIGA